MSCAFISDLNIAHAEHGDVSLLVTVYLDPMVVKVGGEESLATVAEQLGACQYSY